MVLIWKAADCRGEELPDMLSLISSCSRFWIAAVVSGSIAGIGMIAILFTGRIMLSIITINLIICLGLLSLWLYLGNCKLRTRIKVLETTSAEAWAVAMAAREDLQRAQDGWHQMSEELKAARDQAIAANHARAMFVAGMSHELRTPLNAIIGFSEVLELELFGAVGSIRNREYVRDIRESGQHLLSMINDILDMSKIDAGKMALQESVIDVVQLITNCCRLTRTRAASAGIELTVEVGNKPALHVMADELRLKQVLFNLLSNAVKFTPAGGTIQVTACESGPREIAIMVRDSGIGIAAEHLELIFEPFRQVDDSLERRAGGTGLGLALSRALIEMQGGRLFLVSEVGKGTVVTITLPNVVAELSSATGTPQTLQEEGPERVLTWLTEQ